MSAPSARPLSTDQPPLVVRSSAGSAGGGLREVWRFRELLRSLVVRNLKVKYQRSMLGFVWTLLNPLLTVAVLTTVFSYIVKIRIPHYWAFLLSGYFVWNFLLQMLSTATYVLAEHAPLRRSIAFPSEVLVFAAAASRLVEFLVELSLALILLVVAHHQAIPPSYALLPVLILLLILLAVGLTMPIAALAVFYSDVQHALPIVLLMLFYISPVFYPATLVPGIARDIYLLNPIAGLLTLFHGVLYEGRWPAWSLLAGVTAASLAIAALGYAAFNRSKALFAEIV